VEHVCERGIAVARDAQIMGFPADPSVIFIKPSLEIPADLGRSDELERGTTSK
jgi:hypothetical protein